MQRDWLLYHLRSTYKNCLSTPLKKINLFSSFFGGGYFVPEMTQVLSQISWTLQSLH